MEWNWLLSQKKLQQLGIDAILNRYLVIALQQFPDPALSLDKAKMVSGWFTLYHFYATSFNIYIYSLNHC